ncbi:unnamed protein product [Brugia pahangi]|uniref:ANF_receptor domain-containing protein n=1 Tax=Brugia pahangi TaxID=6280 RepID=A0A0N4SZN6_BRUPA|nr:unnamed protein product [Brugia pahangi]
MYLSKNWLIGDDTSGIATVVKLILDVAADHVDCFNISYSYIRSKILLYQRGYGVSHGAIPSRRTRNHSNSFRWNVLSALVTE